MQISEWPVMIGSTVFIMVASVDASSFLRRNVWNASSVKPVNSGLDFGLAIL